VSLSFPFFAAAAANGAREWRVFLLGAALTIYQARARSAQAEESFLSPTIKHDIIILTVWKFYCCASESRLWRRRRWRDITFAAVVSRGVADPFCEDYDDDAPPLGEILPRASGRGQQGAPPANHPNPFCCCWQRAIAQGLLALAAASAILPRHSNPSSVTPVHINIFVAAGIATHPPAGSSSPSRKSSSSFVPRAISPNQFFLPLSLLPPPTPPLERSQPLFCLLQTSRKSNEELFSFPQVDLNYFFLNIFNALKYQAIG
jgi:hypothetical protein